MSCGKRKDDLTPCLNDAGVSGEETSAAYYAGFSDAAAPAAPAADAADAAGLKSIPNPIAPQRKAKFSFFSALISGFGKAMFISFIMGEGKGGIMSKLAFAGAFGLTEFIHAKNKPVPLNMALPGHFVQVGNEKMKVNYEAFDASGRRMLALEDGKDFVFIDEEGMQVSREDFIRAAKGLGMGPDLEDRPLAMVDSGRLGNVGTGDQFILDGEDFGVHSGRTASVLEIQENGVIKVLSYHPEQTNIGMAFLYVNQQGELVAPDGSRIRHPSADEESPILNRRSHVEEELSRTPISLPAESDGVPIRRLSFDQTVSMAAVGDTIRLPDEEEFGDFAGQPASISDLNNGTFTASVQQGEPTPSGKTKLDTVYFDQQGNRTNPDGTKYGLTASASQSPQQASPMALTVFDDVVVPGNFGKYSGRNAVVFGINDGIYELRVTDGNLLEKSLEPFYMNGDGQRVNKDGTVYAPHANAAIGANKPEPEPIAEPKEMCVAKTNDFVLSPTGELSVVIMSSEDIIQYAEIGTGVVAEIKRPALNVPADFTDDGVTNTNSALAKFAAMSQEN